MFPFNHLTAPCCRRVTVAMPIYEYRCSSCGHELEALQKLSEPPLVTCPSCQKETLVKLISAAGFQLKGTGWYVTDFKGASSKSSSSGSTSGSSTTSESKPVDGKPQGSSDAAPAATATPAASPSTPATGTAS